jgi:tetratricopeptide (TPR) repeat protein
LGDFCYLKCRLKEAEKYYQKSAELTQKINILALAGAANYWLSKICLDMREYEKSKQFCRKAISLWQNCHVRSDYIDLLYIQLTLAKVMNNEKDINLNEVLKWGESQKSMLYKVWAQYYISAILLNIRDTRISKAEDWIKRSIRTSQKYGMVWDLARSYALYADLFKRKGDLTKAKEKLTNAIEIFKECGADGWVEKYQKELEQVHKNQHS